MSREAFEKWLNHPKACERGSSTDSINYGDYVREDVQMQWEAWQAGQEELKNKPNVGHMIDKQCIVELERVIERLLDRLRLIVCEPINAEGIAQDALDEWGQNEQRSV